jgi:y4mF family transcriptional regulator
MIHRFLNTVDRVAQTVRERRKELRLTQQKVADLAGVSRKFISELESGHPRAELGKLLAVLDVLGIQASALPAIPAGSNNVDDIDLTEAVARFA